MSGRGLQQWGIAPVLILPHERELVMSPPGHRHVGSAPPRSLTHVQREEGGKESRGTGVVR